MSILTDAKSGVSMHDNLLIWNSVRQKTNKSQNGHFFIDGYNWWTSSKYWKKTQADLYEQTNLDKAKYFTSTHTMENSASCFEFYSFPGAEFQSFLVRVIKLCCQ